MRPVQTAPGVEHILAPFIVSVLIASPNPPPLIAQYSTLQIQPLRLRTSTRTRKWTTPSAPQSPLPPVAATTMRLIAALSLLAAPALAAPVTAGALAYARYIEDNQLTHRRYSRLPMLDLGERQTANAISLYGNCSDLCEGAISFVVDACGTGGEIKDINKCRTACTVSFRGWANASHPLC